MKLATAIRKQTHAPEFTAVMTRLARIEAVTSLLLRTCDDSFKRRMDPHQREVLQAVCDDVRAVLGYPATGRYLTPARRKRLGISDFTFGGTLS